MIEKAAVEMVGELMNEIDRLREELAEAQATVRVLEANIHTDRCYSSPCAICDACDGAATEGEQT